MTGFAFFSSDFTLEIALEHAATVDSMGVFTFPDHDLTVFCYTFLDDIFGNRGGGPIFKQQINREMRGLTFQTSTGKLIGRPYHKFFNYLECEETHATIFEDWNICHYSEKLDGSMVFPVIKDNGEMLWLTKKGISEVSLRAADFVSDIVHYQDFVRHAASKGLQPIFEWIDPAYPIIIRYQEKRLVLTALRHLVTGSYMSLPTMNVYARDFHVECAKFYNLVDGFDLVEHADSIEDHEGFVARSDRGKMVKVKAKDYVFRHRSKTALISEVDVIQYVMDDRLDDILPYLHDTEKDTLIDYQKKVNDGIRCKAEQYEAQFKELVKAGISVKEFNLTTKYSPLDPMYMAMMNTGFANRSFEDNIRNYIKRKYFRLNTIDEIRYLWNNEKWEFNFFAKDE